MRKRRSGIEINSYHIFGNLVRNWWTSLLGFPIQRPNQNEDFQTTNPFFPDLTEQPGGVVHAGRPESSDPIPPRVQGHRRQPHMAQPLVSSKDAPDLRERLSFSGLLLPYFYLLSLQVNKTMAGD